MNFGQKVLEKYGWKKGDGLGKLKDGIKEAIKPKRKANNLGLGFKLGAEFQDNWWEKVFDKAAANVNVGGESAKFPDSDDVEYLPHKKKSSTTTIKESYKLFEKKTECESSDEDVPSKQNDDAELELFLKCGGRTVHKGARHGIRLSGKLERLERQERDILHNTKRRKSKKKKKFRD